MIVAIIIISLAVTWLMYETDWLRVNLCQWYEVGASCDWRLGDGAVTKDMKKELMQSWFYGTHKATELILASHIESGQPLFGWGYAYQFRNVNPDYKIELVDGTSKVTINSNSIPHLRDAFRVWRNPYIKVKLTA